MAAHGTNKDDGAIFEVVPSARKITVPTTHRVLGSVGDHLSEHVTFKCPRTIDGHKVASCDRKYITWKNVDGQIGHDGVKVDTTSDPGYMLLTWSIRNGLTTKKGLVSFSLHFEDVDSKGAITYHWGTSCCTEGEILDSVNGVLGVYQSMYVAGDTLVIQDYTPVEGTTLTLDSAGINPTGQIEIDKDGEYDVTEYAKAKVQVSQPLEAPVITIDKGTVVATANGLPASKPLEKPEIAVREGVVYATANGVPASTPLADPGIEVEDGQVKVAVNDKMFTKDLEAPSISVSTEGVITASVGGVSVTHELSAKDDVDFRPENIAKGKNIFGFEGQFGDEFYKGKIVFRYSGDAPDTMKVRLWFVQKNDKHLAWPRNDIWLSAGEEREVELLKDSIIVGLALDYDLHFDYASPTKNCKNIYTTDRISVARVTGDDFYLTVMV